MRAWRRLKIEPHRATSEVLSVAYPFLAEAGLGSDGPLIGHDSWSGAAFVYDPWALYERGVVTNPNGVLAGVIGRGKSTLAKSLATRSIAFGRRVYVPGDPKGEWTVVAKAVGGTAIELGTGNRLNPLDEGPRPARNRRRRVAHHGPPAPPGPAGVADRAVAGPAAAAGRAHRFGRGSGPQRA